MSFEFAPPPVLRGRWREGCVQVVTKLSRSLVDGAVNAVAGDITLTQGVAAQQVVHAPGDPTINSPIFGQGVGGGEYYQVVQDATVGAPVPAVRRGIWLIPRLLLLQVEQPERGVDYALPDPVVVRQSGALDGKVQSAGSRDAVEIESRQVEDLGHVELGS